MRLSDIEKYNSKDILLEIFDNPYPISNQTILASDLKKLYDQHYSKKISGLNVYERTDSSSNNFSRDVFIIFRYNKLWEVHHANYDDLMNPVSGTVLGIKSNFISTIIKLYMTKIHKGIRIVAESEAMKIYSRILNKYVNTRRDHYHISDIDNDYIGLDGIKRHALTVRPKGKEFLQIPITS